MVFRPDLCQGQRHQAVAQGGEVGPDRRRRRQRVLFQQWRQVRPLPEIAGQVGDVPSRESEGEDSVDRRYDFRVGCQGLEAEVPALLKAPLGHDLILDLEVGVDPGLGGARPQQAEAERVDRRDLSTVERGQRIFCEPAIVGRTGALSSDGVQRRTDAVAQLSGGLIREGDGDDAVDRAAREHQRDDAVDESAGLAGAGPRFDE